MNDFIDGNPEIFLSFEWINVPKLRTFIESEDFRLWLETKCHLLGTRDVRIPVKTEHVAPTLLKNKPDLELDEQRHNGLYSTSTLRVTVSTRTSCNKAGHEVIEILSYSEDEPIQL